MFFKLLFIFNSLCVLCFGKMHFCPEVVGFIPLIQIRGPWFLWVAENAQLSRFSLFFLVFLIFKLLLFGLQRQLQLLLWDRHFMEEKITENKIEINSTYKKIWQSTAECLIILVDADFNLNLSHSNRRIAPQDEYFLISNRHHQQAQQQHESSTCICLEYLMTSCIFL